VAKDYRDLAGKSIAFAEPDVAAFRAIAGAHLDAFTDLGTEVAAAIRRGLQRAVTTGISFEAWSESVAQALQSRAIEGRAAPGIFRTAQTLARTATTQLHRHMGARLDEKLGVERWTYEGPDDEVTRPFCERLVEEANAGTTWTRDEIDALDNSKDNGGAGAGPGSAFEQGGGWNCRHAWIPVLDEDGEPVPEGEEA
jgi:hypothetical protein